MMKTYILHWKIGKNEKVSGEDIAKAITHAGYGAGAILALDYYEEVKAQPNPQTPSEVK